MNEHSSEDKQEDLRARIQEIEEHTQLGSQLEGLVEDTNALHVLNVVMTSLRDLSQTYQRQLDLNIELEAQSGSFEEYHNKQREEFVRDCAVFYGGEENARAYFDTPTKNPKRKAYINLVKGLLYGTCSLLALPLSRSLSNTFLKLKTTCFVTSKNYFLVVEARKKYADAKDERMNAVHEDEFLEARAATMLKRDLKLPDKGVELILEKPELLLYSALHSLRDKYAPWL